MTIFQSTKELLKNIFENELDLDKSNISQTTIDFIIRYYNQAVRKHLKKEYKKKEDLIKMKLKKSYNLFCKKGWDDKEVDILKYSLKDLKPTFKKELEKSINNCLQLCKTQDITFLNKVRDNLLNYCSNTQLQRSQSSFFENVLPKKYDESWQKMIIRDQQKKMIGNLTYITAMRNGAFGFIWKNRQDIRVVGNPNGLYKEWNDKHNNHWKRHNKLYLFKDSEMIKKGLIKKSGDVEWAEEIPDGLPSQAINCRCTMRLLYRLYEIPKKYEYIITEKGKLE